MTHNSSHDTLGPPSNTPLRDHARNEPMVSAVRNGDGGRTGARPGRADPAIAYSVSTLPAVADNAAPRRGTPAGGIEHAWELRRELGRRLKTERVKLGISQGQLAFRLGYTRSAVSNLESASGGYVARLFWERCDQMFGTGQTFTDGYDQVHQAREETAASRRASRTDRHPDAAAARSLRTLRSAKDADSVPQALAAYCELGWHAGWSQGRVDLVTGTAIDALELPRLAGMLAIHWWRYTGGAPDEIRGLPALPHPDEALAVIDTGPSLYFLVQAGSCPWGDDDALAGPPAEVSAPSVGWHSLGSRVPAPPSQLGDGRTVRWAHLPHRGLALPSAIGLLDLLVKAAASLRPGTHALAFPSGVVVAPGPCRVGVPPPAMGIARQG